MKTFREVAGGIDCFACDHITRQPVFIERGICARCACPHELAGKALMFCRVNMYVAFAIAFVCFWGIVVAGLCLSTGGWLNMFSAAMNIFFCEVNRRGAVHNWKSWRALAPLYVRVRWAKKNRPKAV